MDVVRAVRVLFHGSCWCLSCCTCLVVLALSCLLFLLFRRLEVRQLPPTNSGRQESVPSERVAAPIDVRACRIQRTRPPTPQPSWRPARRSPNERTRRRAATTETVSTQVAAAAGRYLSSRQPWWRWSSPNPHPHPHLSPFTLALALALALTLTRLRWISSRAASARCHRAARHPSCALPPAACHVACLTMSTTCSPLTS